MRPIPSWRLAAADENQRSGHHHTADDAGQQQPSPFREFQCDRDGDRDERQAGNADDFHRREVDVDRRKLLAHDALL
jgi:hypothetical protein